MSRLHRSPTEAVIEVRGLCNRFGSQSVHENLDLDLYKGEILAVVGGSGSGKSVLLRSIVGLRRPARAKCGCSARICRACRSMKRSLVERRFGVLFQKGALFSSLTVTENVAAATDRARRPQPRATPSTWRPSNSPSLGCRCRPPTNTPASLSGGMIKRAALARALALDPDILFLDEPTAGLDPIGAAQFDQLILTLRDALGLSVFLVTHDLDTLYTITDRVAVLAQKKVLVADAIDIVSETDDAWIHEYFHGPRGRAALDAARPLNEV